MNVFYYIFRRLRYALAIVVGATLMIFVLFNVVVEDPTLVLLGKYATPQAMEALRHELGLNNPWYVQYWEILQSAFTFNFGYSWASKQNIIKIFQQGIAGSLSVTLPAFVLGNVLTISFALWMTQYRGSIWDRFFLSFSTAMSCIPILLYILMGQWFFAYKLGLFEITGYEKGLLACIPYIMLPTLIMVFMHFCYDYRFYRTIMLDEIYQDYVRTARAKGLSEKVILFKHVLKNVMVPIITHLIQAIPSLLFGSILIENFFGIPGLGNVIQHALHTCDLPMLKATTVVAAIVRIVCNIVGDILYKLVDPRVKL
ncbi:ABC transporter permease [Candidatus Cardinium hertigii]|uniref:Nickel transport system permease protein NikB n=1 Tax=Candidatus Cardinium hertigii TaxID=247481 RepID=A0A2Z3L9A7_9BACT|nr:ABC transporter permease [Candidatus Cardinium hertigii]AWN81961.1 Nickel transport system permease protein NikB [Candidatus Cardinium hertigii]